MSVRAVISLGSNIPPRGKRLRDALDAIGRLEGTSVAKCSSVIETDPVDVPDEYASMKFKNCVALVDTALDADSFSRAVHAVEDAQGRVRGKVRNTPRTIDIDIIAFGDVVRNDPELTLPHPRARARAFVTGPLSEVWPDFKWPGESRPSMRELFASFTKMGALLIGGGYAMLPLLEDEVARRKRWVSSAEVADYFAVAQILPGVIAINTTMLVGYRLRGAAGLFLATAGVVAVPFATIVAYATAYAGIHGLPLVEKALAGARPAAAGMILGMGVMMLLRAVRPRKGRP